MIKKLFTIRTFAVIVLLMILYAPNALAITQSDPTPDQLHKSSQFTGLMVNMKYLYDKYVVSANDVYSVDKFLSHDLIYKVKDTELKNYDEVKTEFSNEILADKFKNKKVDIYGSNYYKGCYFSEERKYDKEPKGKTCMYGGVTENSGNHFDDDLLQSVTVHLYEDGINTISFDIQTDKKRVTAQELDIKVRNFLINKKNLYEFNDSPYETGYIKFIEGNSSFWYDMMPGPGEIFEQSKYLMMYSDNKTVDSKNIKIEVHLTKKNEQVNRRIAIN
ncbi:exotoxin [Staphylococcus pseudintermedius]|uniref:exotoxin n=1 Tax=Staphylococcus pseudintermedius TaxID=283734 RepID=UPI002EDBA272